MRVRRRAVHAYVLMPNHVHLLLTPDEPTGISRLMKQVGQRYAQYVNRTTARSGPLWEGRFKSSVIADDAYLLACYRYIEMNPVRARLACDPAQYAWSSHRANAGIAIDPLVKRHPLYIGLAGNDEACAPAYRRLFESPLHVAREEEIRHAIAHCSPLERPEFRARLEVSTQVASMRIGATPAQNQGQTPTAKTGV